MSLRKSPTLTPALLAANRRNAKKSTGPRTARGKAWSRLNSLRDGGYSRDHLNFLMALLDAPTEMVEATALALLEVQTVNHRLFLDLANRAVQIESELIQEALLRRAERENEKNDFRGSEAGRLLKTKDNDQNGPATH